MRLTHLPMAIFLGLAGSTALLNVLRESGLTVDVVARLDLLVSGSRNRLSTAKVYD